MTTTGISFQSTNKDNLLTFSTTGDIGILTGNPLGTFDISSPYFVIVPKGTTGQRPGNYTGCIRFNSTLGILEGYRGGSSSGWWPLYNQGSDDMNSRISFDDGEDDNYNIHFYTNNTKRMTLTEDGNLCIGSTTGEKKINVSGAINIDNLYYNGTLFKTIPDYIYQNLTFNDTYGSRNSGYYDTHSIDVSQNLDVSGTPTINTKLYVYNDYNQPYSTKIRGDFETSRLELTDMNYDNALNIGSSTGNLPYSRNGDVRVNTETKHFQVYYNNNWRTSKSLQRPFMAFESNGTNGIAQTNNLHGLTRVNLKGGKYITNDTTTFSCVGTNQITSRFIIYKPGLYLLTIGVVFSSSSSNKFRYILFKSNSGSNSSNNTDSTSFYSPGTRDYLFNDTGLDSGAIWSNIDTNKESQVDGATYYDQVQDFGEINGSGLTEKTIPFILESGKSITMFAAYQGNSFQKLYMRFLRLGITDSIVNGTSTTILGINTYTVTGESYEENPHTSTIDGIDYISIRFLDNGVIKFDQKTKVDVLLVAGGGGGGPGGYNLDIDSRGHEGAGGGGGAGGVLVAEAVEFTGSVTNNIIVGDGGQGVGARWSNAQRLSLSTGEDTIIEEVDGAGLSMRAIGGGAGASVSPSGDLAKRIGGNGGSGGGGGWYHYTWDGGHASASGTYSGGSAIDGTITYPNSSATFHGNSGGRGKEYSLHDVGGGGGAGGRPTVHCHPRTYEVPYSSEWEGFCGSYWRDSQTGGVGIINNFWDSDPNSGNYYGGGGAGSGGKAIGRGGIGGGGNYVYGNWEGTDGLGGGGSGTSGDVWTAYAGGSGVVILRFKTIG